jgi:hypothetical protein
MYEYVFARGLCSFQRNLRWDIPGHGLIRIAWKRNDEPGRLQAPRTNSTSQTWSTSIATPDSRVQSDSGIRQAVPTLDPAGRIARSPSPTTDEPGDGLQTPQAIVRTGLELLERQARAPAASWSWPVAHRYRNDAVINNYRE